MRDLPNAGWAFLFLVLACALAGLALLARGDGNLSTAIITLASSIATGAFGYIQGHRDGQTQNPPPPADPAH